MSEAVHQGVPQPQGWGEDPLTHFSRTFCRFLQLVFASFSSGSYHWDADDRLSDLIISDQATIAKEVVERRPAILVSRGPASFANVTMDQFAGPLLEKNSDGSTAFTPNYDPGAGSNRFTDLIAATMTYNVISKEGIEAQRIAWMAMYATRALKSALLQSGLHRVGEELQVGSESSPGSIVQPDPNEVVLVSVQVPFYFQDTWTVAPLDKNLLTQVVIGLRSGNETDAPPQVQLRGPSIYGHNLSDLKVTTLDKVLVGPWKSPKPLKK